MPPVEFCIALLVAVAGLARLAGRAQRALPDAPRARRPRARPRPRAARVQLDPDVVLLVFLPPLSTSRPSYLARGSCATTVARSGARDRPRAAHHGRVAVVAHAVVVGLSWPAAFVLGAIVAPDRPGRRHARLPPPRRAPAGRDVVEGEALVNDGTALIAYRVALGAVTGTAVSRRPRGLQFFGGALGGMRSASPRAGSSSGSRAHLDDPPVEITITFFTPYLAYLPAERLGLSGVLAAVAAGLYLAWQSPTGCSPPRRACRPRPSGTCSSSCSTRCSSSSSACRSGRCSTRSATARPARSAGGAALVVPRGVATRAAVAASTHFGRSFGGAQWSSPAPRHARRGLARRRAVRPDRRSTAARSSSF